MVFKDRALGDITKGVNINRNKKVSVDKGLGNIYPEDETETSD